MSTAIPFTLLSNTQAAPSANLSGTYAMGATEGALLPSQPTYGQYANPTSPDQRQQYYQTQQQVLGAQTQNNPTTPPPTSPPAGGNNNNNGAGGSSGPGYSPTFSGQTVQVGNQTWKSNGSGGWDLVSSGPQGISQADLDNAFNPVYSTINDLYSSANANKQSYLDAATSPFDALQPGIDAAQTQGLNLNQQQVGQNDTQTQNALAAARQLYNELQQGVQQRFGGASSAGDFAKAFYGRQLQQNEGQAYGTQGQNAQALNTQAQNIIAQHAANTQQLAAQKAAALANAQQSFQQKLDQINGLKLQTDQQKAAAKLGALQTLNSTANAIQQQFAQFQQNLVLQNQSALDQLRNGVATAQAYSGQPINLSAIAPAFYSQMGGAQGGGYNPYFQVTGNAGNRDQFNNVTGNLNPTNKNQFGLPQ